jgi:hypothetical protein
MQLQSGVCMNSMFNDSSVCKFCGKEAPLKHSFFECTLIDKQVFNHTHECLQKLLSCMPNLDLKFTWEDDIPFKSGMAISPRGALSPGLGKLIKMNHKTDILVYKIQEVVCLLIKFLKEP